MKVKCRTTEELIRMGFKTAWDYGHWYRGNRRTGPEAKVRCGIVQQLAGKVVEVVEIEDASEGIVRVRFDGHDYERVPTWFFTEQFDFAKVVSPPTFGRGRNQSKYILGRFHFPCDLSDTSRARARELAKWVLEVSK